RILLGYNIYRDDEEIGFMAEGTLAYLDEGLNAGNYSYYVTGVYDNGESEPSSPASATVTLPAPLNFSANSQGGNGNVICIWSAPAENRSLSGYKVYRDDVEIAATTGTFYLDTGVPTGTYTYHVTAMYNDIYESEASNQVEVDHVDADDTAIPLVTELNGNYPNPFNPVTSIKFSLHERDHVRIEIFNLKGEKVSTLVNEELDAAFYSITWNGTDDNQRPVTSGVYFYKMQAGKFISARKMILMK
ncbi:MAG: T9SS type A sorting domain-containing protein, partial [Candidatus Cloacimonetes bacterium]|nr:T9SS type A sorting domain-containing protein [Candidatus Cloacimonadota bacterium]